MCKQPPSGVTRLRVRPSVQSAGVPGDSLSSMRARDGEFPVSHF